MSTWAVAHWNFSSPWNFSGKNTGVVAIFFSRNLLTQGLNSHISCGLSPHCRQTFTCWAIRKAHIGKYLSASIRCSQSSISLHHFTQFVLHQLLSLKEMIYDILHKVPQRCIHVQGEWWVVTWPLSEKANIVFKESHGYCQKGGKKKRSSRWLTGLLRLREAGGAG